MAAGAAAVAEVVVAEVEAVPVAAVPVVLVRVVLVALAPVLLVEAAITSPLLRGHRVAVAAADVARQAEAQPQVAIRAANSARLA